MTDDKKNYQKDIREKAQNASKKMLEAGWGFFGDVKGILQYSIEEEIELMRSTRMFLYALSGGCLILFLWMAFSPLDVVSMAEGEVTPSSALKSVQHFEGGIVKEIKVSEGDEVKKGQTLVVLESTASGASVTELATRIASLEADLIRLDAEAVSEPGEPAYPEYPEALEKQHPLIIKQSMDSFKARHSRFSNEIRAAREKIHQREQDVKEVKARLDNLADRLAIANEQVAISEDLLKDELTNRYNHLELLREVSVINSNIEEDEAAFERAQAQLNEMLATFDGIRHSYIEDINNQREDARTQLEESKERMLKLEDSFQRTILNAPADGVVQKLHVKTVGGVVKPGETVVDIVPAGDQLIIEARLPVEDVGYISLGQRATVRLASADAMRFQKLDGEVVYIAADSEQNEETGDYFYRVKIEVGASQFEGAGGLTYKLYPGMQVNSNIVTGRRTVLSYVLTPFLESSFESLQER